GGLAAQPLVEAGVAGGGLETRGVRDDAAHLVHEDPDRDLLALDVAGPIAGREDHPARRGRDDPEAPGGGGAAVAPARAALETRPRVRPLLVAAETGGLAEVDGRDPGLRLRHVLDLDDDV